MSPFREPAPHEPEAALAVPDFRAPPKLALGQRAGRWSFILVSVAWLAWTLFGIVTSGAVGWLLFVVAVTLGIFGALLAVQHLMTRYVAWQGHRVARRVAELMLDVDRSV